MAEISWTIMVAAWIIMFIAWGVTLMAALNFKRQRDHWQKIADYRAAFYNPKRTLGQKEESP